MKLEINSLTENQTASNEIVSEVDLNQVSAEDVTQHLKDGIAAAKNGQRAEAKVLLLRVTEADPKNETAWLWLASISEYPEELLVFLQNVLNVNPENERALEWSKATKTLLSKTFVQRGVTASHSGNKELAKQSFLQAIVYDNTNEMAWLWLASVAEQSEEKLSHLNKVLSLNPNNETAISSMKVVKNQVAQISLKKANQLAVVGDRDLARQHLEEVLKYDNNIEEAWLLKAILTDSFDEKASYFNKVLAINPDNLAARAGLSSIEAILQAAISVPDVKNEQSAEVDNSNEVELASDEEVFEAVERAFIDPRNEFENNDVQETVEVNEFQSVAEMNFSEVVEEEKSVETAETEKVAELEEVNSFQDFSESFEQVAEPVQESETVQSLENEVVEAKENSEVETELLLSQEVSNFESFETEQTSDTYKTEELDKEVLENAEAQFNKTDEPAMVETVEVQAQSPEEDIHQTFVEEVVVNQPVEEVSVVENKVDESPIAETQTVESVESNEFFEQPTELQFAEELKIDSFEEEAQSESNEQVAETPQPQIKAETEPVKVVEPQKTATFEEFNQSFSQMKFTACAFCGNDNLNSTAICHSCNSVINLADLDMVFDYHKADRSKLIESIQKMESEKNSRQFSSDDFVNLGLAYLNLQNFKSGHSNLQKALELNPTSISLVSQIAKLEQYLQEVEKNKPEPVESDTKIVMIVDDSPTVRKLVSTKLEKCGHTVVSAIDGMDALAKINETIPDLILLDITMPRLDGYQVCKLIRGNELTKDIPIIMISGKDGFFDKVRGRMAGSSGYITKPFGPDTLMKTLESHFSPVN
jgi:CheY-like chemotaxis protein